MPLHVPVPGTGKRIWFALGFYQKPLKRPGCGVWAATGEPAVRRVREIDWIRGRSHEVVFAVTV
jgi:hypothetical protein